MRERKCKECGRSAVESDFIGADGVTRPWCSDCRKSYRKRKDAKQSKAKLKPRRKGSRKERRPASEPRRRPPRISAAERDQRQHALAVQHAEDELRRQQLVAEREEREREHDALAARRPGQRLIGLDGPTPAQLRLAELTRRVAEEQRLAYGDG